MNENFDCNESALKIESLEIQGDAIDNYRKEEEDSKICKQFIDTRINQIENYLITTQENEHMYITQITILTEAKSILFKEN